MANLFKDAITFFKLNKKSICTNIALNTTDLLLKGSQTLNAWLVHCHFLWVMTSRTWYHGGLPCSSVSPQHRERRLPGEVDTGICAVVSTRTWSSRQVLRWTPRFVSPRDGVTGTGCFGQDTGAHERREDVFVWGRYGVHRTILCSIAHGVGWRFAMDAAQRGFLRTVCSWSRGGEDCCCNYQIQQELGTVKLSPLIPVECFLVVSTWSGSIDQ